MATTKAWHHRDGSECFSARVWQNDDDPNQGTCEMHERVVCYAEVTAEPADPAESSEPPEPPGPPTPEPKPVKQMPYREALDYALFAVNTWMHPDASLSEDIIELETNSDAVIATLVDIRDVVAGAPAPAPDYDTSRQTFVDAINLGIEVESDDPAFGSDVKALTPAQVRWISSWLAGEGHR